MSEDAPQANVAALRGDLVKGHFIVDKFYAFPHICCQDCAIRAWLNAKAER